MDIHLAVIEKEITLGRISGPFPNIGVTLLKLFSNTPVPLDNTSKSILKKILCSVSYASVDQTISRIQENDYEALISKIDLCSAFRLLPIYLLDFPLFGMCISEITILINACHLDSLIACLCFKNSRKEDDRIWFTILDEYNGPSPFPEWSWSDNDTLHPFIASCGSCGESAIFKNHFDSWDPDIQKDITIFE